MMNSSCEGACKYQDYGLFVTPGKNRPCIVSKADWDEKSITECHQRTMNDHIIKFKEGLASIRSMEWS